MRRALIARGALYLLLLVAATACLAPVVPAQSRVPWIDVHVHLIADTSAEQFDEAARAALQLMDAEGITTIVAMSPPRPRASADFEYLAAIAKKYAPRIVVLGGGSSLNPMLFEATQQRDVPETVR